MKKNKLIKLVGVITLMIFCLIGCGNEAQQETDEYSVRFVPRIANNNTCNPWESYH